MSTIPIGWTEVALGDVVTPRGEKASPKDLGNCPFIGMDHVEAHSSKLLGTRPVSDMKSNVSVFKEGDILYGRLRPYLNKVLRAPFDGAASAEFIVLPPAEHIDLDFLRLVLRHPQFVQFASQKSTGDRPRVKFSSIADYSFLLPPLSEQRRIVTRLSNVLDKAHRAQDELKNVSWLGTRAVESILRSAFKGHLTAGWREAHPNEVSVEVKAPKRKGKRKSRVTVDRDSFEQPYQLPEGWRWLPLPYLGQLDRGKSRHRPRNDPKLFGGPHPFIQTGEVRAANGILTEFDVTYSDFGLAQSRLWPVGTVCITIAANIAETAILGIEACFPDSVVGFIADNEVCSGRYVEYFIRTVRSDLQAFAPATAQKNINLGTLSELFVPVAPRREQDVITSCIDAGVVRFGRMESETEDALRLTGALETCALTKALSGQLFEQ